MTFYEFTSNSPWLTFFLAYMMGHVIIVVIKAIFGNKVGRSRRKTMGDDDRHTMEKK